MIKKREELKRLRQICNAMAVKVTSIFRLKAAKKRLRLLHRDCKLAMKLQRRLRIFRAKRELSRLKLESGMAVRVQAIMRGVLLREKLRHAAIALQELKTASAMIIQRSIRGAIAIRKTNILRSLRRDYDSTLPLSVWIDSYGVDKSFGSKRNRRIILRGMRNLLSTPVSRIQSIRFGVVFVQKYEEALNFPIQPFDVDSLAGSLAFVRATFPFCKMTTLSTNQARVAAIQTSSYYIILHVSSSIDHIASVSYFVIRIQCRLRQRWALQRVRVRRVLIRFLMRVKRRFLFRKSKALRIVNSFRRVRAVRACRKLLILLRKEKLSVLILQRAVRCWRARLRLWECRHIPLEVKQMSELTLRDHGASFLFDGLENTFWMVHSAEVAEITLSLTHKQCISEVAVVTSMYSASPRYITIRGYVSTSKTYKILVDRAPLASPRQRLWQHVYLKSHFVTKYLKITFESNYGDLTCMGMRSIAVVKAKERKMQFLIASHFCLFILLFL